jgi:Ca-activated chloride channel homolog
MSVHLSCDFSDRYLDDSQTNSQRQLAISVSADPSRNDSNQLAVNSSTDSERQYLNAPLNLCLVLDHSGSMGGEPLDTVKKAARDIIDQLDYLDYISVVGFDHKAKVIVPNQSLSNPEFVKDKIQSLRANGGTCIDDAIKLALQELSKSKASTISQAFVLTDGENEHGNNSRCLEFAKLAAEYGMTLHTLGFGDNWNQDVLEKIADAGGGTMAYIETPDRALNEFRRLLHRIQSVGLINSHLLLKLAPNVRLAELKPIAQVNPDTIELEFHRDKEGTIVIRLGDLMTDVDRTVMINLYISHDPETAIAGSAADSIQVLSAQIRYDDPISQKVGILSLPVAADLTLIRDYQPLINPQVQQNILTLAKYRQTQLAETKLKQGDRTGAATMLQSAAKTALQMGDQQAATVLQTNATRLQSGTNLSEAERKQTRMVSKTVLQTPEK